MTRLDEVDVIRRWARVGVAFAEPEADATPDLERLLLDTARCASRSPRLVVHSATWLAHFDLCVARHRLAYLAGEELEAPYVHVLGYLIDSVHEHLAAEPFRDVLAACTARVERADPEPGPLYDSQRRTPRLAQLARAGTSETGRRWRLWAQPFELRPEALRPPRWVMERNPLLRRQADLGGDLRASIIATLHSDPDAGASAVEIQRRCACRSYPPVLKAIQMLERSGTIERDRTGTSKRIRLLKAAG